MKKLFCVSIFCVILVFSLLFLSSCGNDSTTSSDLATHVTDPVVEEPDIPNGHSISVVQSNNGTISPISATLQTGEDKTFYVLPDRGYYISKLTVDDTDIVNGDLSKYVFENVSTNHKISAEFTATDNSTANYTVKHFFENFDGDMIEDEGKRQVLQGTVGDKIVVDTLYENECFTPYVLGQNVVNKNNGTICEVYYYRKVYALEFSVKLNGSEITLGNVDIEVNDENVDLNENIEYYYGEQLSITAEISNYYFVYWTADAFSVDESVLSLNKEVEITVDENLIVDTFYLCIVSDEDDKYVPATEDVPLSYKMNKFHKLDSSSYTAINVETDTETGMKIVDLGTILPSDYFGFSYGEAGIELFGFYNRTNDYYYATTLSNKSFRMSAIVTLEGASTTYLFIGKTGDYDTIASITANDVSVELCDKNWDIGISLSMTSANNYEMHIDSSNSAFNSSTNQIRLNLSIIDNYFGKFYNNNVEISGEYYLTLTQNSGKRTFEGQITYSNSTTEIYCINVIVYQTIFTITVNDKVITHTACETDFDSTGVYYLYIDELGSAYNSSNRRLTATVSSPISLYSDSSRLFEINKLNGYLTATDNIIQICYLEGTMSKALRIILVQELLEIKYDDTSISVPLYPTANKITKYLSYDEIIELMSSNVAVDVNNGYHVFCQNITNSTEESYMHISEGFFLSISQSFDTSTGMANFHIYLVVANNIDFANATEKYVIDLCSIVYL